MLNEVVGMVILDRFAPTFKLRMCNPVDVTVRSGGDPQYAVRTKKAPRLREGIGEGLRARRPFRTYFL